jgi:uncharacterized protein YndB with AHSA1/START domain
MLAPPYAICDGGRGSADRYVCVVDHYRPDRSREDTGLSHRGNAKKDIRRNLATARRKGGAPVEEAHVEPIRQTVSVGRDPERAFELFTNQMGTWWPVESYSRAVSEFANEDVNTTRLEFEARMGGSILEHMSDGRILPWGEVIAWHPPDRVVLAWRPHSAPEPPTEIEVTFVAREGGTLVELEHRGWQRLSEGFREGLYEIYARGWPTTLGCFAAAAGHIT